MSLYNDLKTRVEPISLTNDSMLYMGGYQQWETIITNHNLSAQGETDLAAILSYWRGKIDNAPTDSEEEKVKNDFQRRILHGFLGDDRKQLTEAQFYEILEINPPGGN